MGDTGADNNEIRILKRSDAVRSQLQGDTHFAQRPDRICQLCFIGCIGNQNPGTPLMQEAGARKPGASQADNYNIFIF
jgi:hypothetical protein